MSPSGVTFSNDVEEAEPVVVAPPEEANQAPHASSNAHLRSAKDRASLSQSAKMWDLDGDGELDDAELALRAMDKSHKGTLSKEQMYELMTQNLHTQRELFKVKKVVMGLVAFTCVLALSNLGTSFAAAFLAKDTKSEDGKFVDAATGLTLKTDTTATKFKIDPEFDQQFSRRRKLECEGTTTGSGANAVTDIDNCEISENWSAVSMATGKAIIEACHSDGSVRIIKYFDGGNKEVPHNPCPLDGDQPTYTGMNGNQVRGLSIARGGQVIKSILPNAAGTAYELVGFYSDATSGCDANTDCASGLICNSDHTCTTPPFTATLALIGEDCSVNNCASGLTCESNICKGTIGVSCDKSADPADQHHQCATDLACGGFLEWPEGVCQCANKNACGKDEVCYSSCTTADGGNSCTTQSALDQECTGYMNEMMNDNNDYQCNRSTGICDPVLPTIVIALIGEDCSVNNCASGLTCESNICKGTIGVSCDKSADPADQHHQCATDLACGGFLPWPEGVCQCANNNACGTGQICYSSCTTADGGNSCTTQSALNQDCTNFMREINNDNHNYQCNTSTGNCDRCNGNSNCGLV